MCNHFVILNRKQLCVDIIWWNIKQRDDSQAASPGKSVQAQLKRYVAYDHGEVCFNENGEVKEINPVSFWSDSQVRISMPGLALLADLVLSVPASSAPVERLFGHGGIIFRPHRRRLTDEHLSEMIFAKCNRLYQWGSDWTLSWIVQWPWIHDIQTFAKIIIIFQCGL